MSTTSDILVLGATGFTGRLITRYLFSHPQHSDFTFAIAARSKSKLNALVSELGLDDSVEVNLFDVTKFEEVEEIVKRTKVVINTVGPFWRWGTPVVKACVRHGIHYVDLTGETPWVIDIIHEFDYHATRSGAIIIPGCGMDSIPSDVSVFLSNKTLKKIAGPDACIDKSTTGFKFKGALSGGTLNSAFSTIERIPRDKLDHSFKPYVLSPVKGITPPAPRIFYTLPNTRPPIKGGFFFMSSTNTALVQHTWGLHELEMSKFSEGSDVTIHGETREHAKSVSYGPQFVYEEFVITNGVIGTLLYSLGFAVVNWLLFNISPVRWFVKKFGLQPGEGPSEEVMQKGFLETINITSSVATPDIPQTHIKTVTRGKGDPGYSLTAVMIAESALSIVFSFDKLPHLGRRGGILTPMSALGDVLIERLKGSGRFEFESGEMGDGGKDSSTR